jgi:hypothetical protein
MRYIFSAEVVKKFEGNLGQSNFMILGTKKVPDGQWGGSSKWISQMGSPVTLQLRPSIARCAFALSFLTFLTIWNTKVDCSGERLIGCRKIRGF